MKTLRMTDRWIRTISVESGREEYCDSVVRGLRLRVSSASKKWSAVTRRGGKQMRTNIGDYPEISLGDARKHADHILNSKTEAAARGETLTDDDLFPSLQTLCEDYVEQMKAKGQRSHDAYHRALIRSDHSFCNYMERVLKRPARVVDVKQEHAVDWLRELLNAFASQDDPHMRAKCLKRLAQLGWIEVALDRCLGAAPRFRLPGDALGAGAPARLARGARPHRPGRAAQVRQDRRGLRTPEGE